MPVPRVLRWALAPIPNIKLFSAWTSTRSKDPVVGREISLGFLAHNEKIVSWQQATPPMQWQMLRDGMLKCEETGGKATTLNNGKIQQSLLNAFALLLNLVPLFSVETWC